MLLLCTFYIFLIGIQPLALLSVLWCSLAQQMSKTKLSSYFHIHMSDILAKKTQWNKLKCLFHFWNILHKKESVMNNKVYLSRCNVAGKFNVNVAKPCVVWCLWLWCCPLLLFYWFSLLGPRYPDPDWSLSMGRGQSLWLCYTSDN